MITTEFVEIDNVKYYKHPLNIFPEMDFDSMEFKGIVSSLIKKGFDKTKPIVMYQGKVLRGWNRTRAIAIARKTNKKLKMVSIQYQGNDVSALDDLLEDDFYRRQLTSEQIAALVVKNEKLYNSLLEKVKSQEPKKDNVVELDKNRKANESKTAYKIAEEVGTNANYINKANQIKKVDEDGLDDIISGDKSINEVYNEKVKKQEPTKKEEPKNLRRNEKAIKQVLDTVWNLSDERSGKEYSKVIQYLHEDIKEKLDVLRTWDIDKLETTCYTCNGMGVIGDKKTKCPDCMGGRIGEYPLGYDEWLEQQVIS
jgi:hypothetical protein